MDNGVKGGGAGFHKCSLNPLIPFGNCQAQFQLEIAIAIELS